MADQVVPTQSSPLSSATTATTTAVAAENTSLNTSLNNSTDASMNGLDPAQVHAADRSTSPSSAGADTHAPMQQEEPDSDSLSNAIGMSGAFSGHLVVKVAAADVGRIIGRNGQNIHDLQELTGARIFLSHDPQDGDFRRVRITGTREQVHHCHVRLQLKITPRDQAARIKALQQEARKFEEPPSKAVVNISTVHIGRVIGKRGQTIQHLQELSGAHIELPKEYSKEESFRTLTITGTSQQVTRCQELIELFSTEPNMDMRPSMQGHFPLAMTMLIPNKHVGRVIGKKGAHIKDIQEQSGAIIHLPKTSRYGSDHREVCIYGTAEAIARCQELLQATMTPAEHEGESMMMQTPGGWTTATAISPAGAVAAVPHVPTFNSMPQVMTAYPYDFSFPVYMPQMAQEYDAYVPGYNTPPYNTPPYMFPGQVQMQVPYVPTGYVSGSPAFGRRIVGMAEHLTP